MERRYGGHATGTQPGSLRLDDGFNNPSEAIDCDLEHGTLFVLGKQVPMGYAVKPGSVGVSLTSLTAENIRDLRDECTAELDRRAGL